MLRGGEEEVVRFRGEGGESSVQSGESGISGICDHRPLCAPTYSIRRYPPTTYLLRWRCGFAHFTALLILEVGVGDLCVGSRVAGGVWRGRCAALRVGWPVGEWKERLVLFLMITARG